MRLKRLELQGFKSFLDRTILTFEPGITGVVGPNGCGKSNIVDAIQWVMGEQSAKHLRGEQMTDVIFNGSDHKAPTSMAEVTLVLDRRGVALSPNFSAFEKGDDISVTRRVYRDGTGEFLINKSPCRLKDIHELFMDTGIGRRAYSIIEQGQIDRMVSAKPEERRLLFEEVAGITKYKSKRKEAEKKLEMTRQNLLRLQDILGELEKQIRSLKVQATRARKYKELKTELETVDLFILGKSLFSHKKAIDELSLKRDDLSNLRSQSDAQFAQSDAEVTELEILRIDQEKSYQQLGEKERDLSIAVQKLENQLSLNAERRRTLDQSLEAGRQEEEEIKSVIAQLEAEEVECQEERSSLEAQITELADSIQEKEHQLRLQQEQRTRALHMKEALQDKKLQLSHRMSTVESQRHHATLREKEVQDARIGINQKLTDIVVTMEAQKTSIRDIESKIEDCALRGEQANQEVNAVDDELEKTSHTLSEMEDAVFKQREQFHSRKSRLQSLEELQENLEGYSPTAREILLRLNAAETIATPVGEVLQPDADIEDHLEMLLGADMNTLIVRTTEEAESLARQVHEQGLERVRVLALNELTNAPSVSRPSNAVSLLSKVRVPSGFEAAANWLLGASYVCASSEDVFEMRRQYPDCTFVALDTKAIGHEDRSLSSGAMPTKVGVFARKREIEELKVALAEIERELDKLTQDRENTLQHLQVQEKRHAELKDNVSRIHIESVEFRKERERFTMELNRTDRDYSMLMKESERNHAQLDDMRVQLEKCVEEIAVLQSELDSLNEDMKRAEEDAESAARGLDELSRAVSEGRVARSGKEEKRNSLEYKLNKFRSDIEQNFRRQQNILAQRDRDEQELSGIDQAAREVREELENANDDRNSTLVKISDVKAAFNDTCTRLQDLRASLTDLQKKRDALLIEMQETEVRVTQEQSSFEQLRGISLERYQTEAVSLDESHQIDIATLPLFAAQLEVEWPSLDDKDRGILLKEHLKNMREKIARYGEVNLTAITEFDEVQKRYDFLIEQKADLEKSIAILEEAIVKIDESTKQRFEETFTAVNAKFKEIFPILFNGGKAELTLTEGVNTLEAGVDIMVHPPGKRPASITLLSGGEKALTAVSLILAIFARKPSPFCLLDEVDAPLDDANVSRFNTVVRKMAEKTQFIVITHNKKTMEVAEALYGVTMEKAGISKMTSVRLN